MISSTQNNSLANYYFGFLENLNSDSKLDLISKLSLSLKGVNDAPEASLPSLFGAYKSEETAEEMIADLKNSRLFNQDIEDWTTLTKK
jgi:hypothetical protein